MRIWSRLAAIAVLSVPFARWVAAKHASEMAHYRTLDRASLLAALQAQHRLGPALSYVAAFVGLAACVFAVHGLAVLIERVTGATRVERD